MSIYTFLINWQYWKRFSPHLIKKNKKKYWVSLFIDFLKSRSCLQSAGISNKKKIEGCSFHSLKEIFKQFMELMLFFFEKSCFQPIMQCKTCGAFLFSKIVKQVVVKWHSDWKWNNREKQWKREKGRSWHIYESLKWLHIQFGVKG